jgi:hypothetical protein
MTNPTMVRRVDQPPDRVLRRVASFGTLAADGELLVSLHAGGRC